MWLGRVWRLFEQLLTRIASEGSLSSPSWVLDRQEERFGLADEQLEMDFWAAREMGLGDGCSLGCVDMTIGDSEDGCCIG